MSLGDDGDVDVVAGQVSAETLDGMRLAQRGGVQHVE